MPRVYVLIEPGRPKHFLVVLLYGLATIAFALAFWLGPLAYGVIELSASHGVLGTIVTALGAVWALLLARDGTIVGLLAGAVHTTLIFAGLMKDPWEGER